MPIIRKLVVMGDSKVVCVPKSWIEYIEKTTGQRVRKVAVEVNGVLKISPILEA